MGDMEKSEPMVLERRRWIRILLGLLASMRATRRLLGLLSIYLGY
jgi:hypothetical protein